MLSFDVMCPFVTGLDFFIMNNHSVPGNLKYDEYYDSSVDEICYPDFQILQISRYSQDLRTLSHFYHYQIIILCK